VFWENHVENSLSLSPSPSVGTAHSLWWWKGVESHLKIFSNDMCGCCGCCYWPLAEISLATGSWNSCTGTQRLSITEDTPNMVLESKGRESETKKKLCVGDGSHLAPFLLHSIH
jgi:hypothetical protein